MGDCCTRAYPNSVLNQFWTYNTTSRTCYLYGATASHLYYCNQTDLIFGDYTPPPKYDYCECERTFKAIGRENLSVYDPVGGEIAYPAGGEW
jgi:hypothetical protein